MAEDICLFSCVVSGSVAEVVSVGEQVGGGRLSSRNNAAWAVSVEVVDVIGDSWGEPWLSSGVLACTLLLRPVSDETLFDIVDIMFFEGCYSYILNRSLVVTPPNWSAEYRQRHVLLVSAVCPTPHTAP